MDLAEQVIIIFSIFVFSFFYLRCFFYGIKLYQLNNSAYKKRKKGETFKEWFLYSRYTEEIPKILRILYFSNMFLHAISLLACIFFDIIGLTFSVGDMIARVIFSYDGIWILILELLFWSPKGRRPYERWIVKRRGQTKK